MVLTWKDWLSIQKPELLGNCLTMKKKVKKQSINHNGELNGRT